MPLVFAGVCSHAPGITGRAERADPALRDGLYEGFDRMRQAIEDSGAEALVVIGAEHFANFFMNNMPAFCIGMGETYTGPIEDEAWLGIRRTDIPGAPDLSRRLVVDIMNDVDVAYAEEWQFDHGIMVPLHFLTPLHRAWAFGKALRAACDAAPEKIAIVGTGGISHWPATPDSGKINEDWDRKFLDRFVNNRRDELLSYTTEETYRDGGQGGFETRTFIAVAGATEGATGEVWFYAPIPIFAVGCTVATMNVA